MKSLTVLGKNEIQSGNRVKLAEGLILQLPNTHDGRNSWLLNYGVSDEAKKFRDTHVQRLKEKGYEKNELSWNEEDQCLNPAE